MFSSCGNWVCKAKYEEKKNKNNYEIWKNIWKDKLKWKKNVDLMK